MSYMREPIYIWVSDDGDGATLHIGTEGRRTLDLDAQIPMSTFDELVMMRVAELSLAEMYDAARRAVERYAGNGGCDALCQEMGVPGLLPHI